MPTLEPFTLADGSALAKQQTQLRLGWDQNALYVHFTCQDDDIQGAYTQRDDPLYTEEVVEVFLSPGAVDPVRYFELEVNPNAVLFDATIYNPHAHGGTRLGIDTAWNPDIRWKAERNDVVGMWWAALILPWRQLYHTSDFPKIWRANFYRIERSQRTGSEFSCWSPVMTDPADFHRPPRFGFLEFSVAK